MGFLERRIFTIAWTAGALIVLWCQIIAVGMPPVTAGSQRIILIGPAAVVLAVLPVDFLVMWLLIRRDVPLLIPPSEESSITLSDSPAWQRPDCWDHF